MAGAEATELLKALLSTDNDVRSKAEVIFRVGTYGVTMFGQ